ncbi:MAG: restriction endonuclease subunit S [Planctomycetes bacterium]|nr:restriction endonuclease subunit S [Planctomycetota bacterium]
MKIKTLKASQKTKRTPIGEIPVDWAVINLGKYIKEVSQRNSENGKPVTVLSVTNSQGFVSSEKYFDKQVYSKDLSNYKVIQKGQFAYNPSRINVGSIARLKAYDKGLLSPMYVVFEAAQELDCDFMEYWISSQYFRNMVKANTQGTVRNAVSFSALAEFLLRYPSLSEQKKIAEILASVDAVIDLTRAVIDQTKTVKKGLMQELLTRGIPGRHKRFKKTELGMIPEEWEVTKLQNICLRIQDGTHFSPKSKTGSRMYITSKNIRMGHMDFNNVSFISEKEHSEIYKRCPVKHGDILLTKDGAQAGNLAVNTLEEEFSLLSSVVMIRPNTNKVLSHYIFHFYSGNFGQDLISNEISGQAITRLTLDKVKNLPVIIPTLHEQSIMTSVFNFLDKNMERNRMILEELNRVKSALMQVLLSGQVRVRI